MYVNRVRSDFELFNDKFYVVPSTAFCLSVFNNSAFLKRVFANFFFLAVLICFIRTRLQFVSAFSFSNQLSEGDSGMGKLYSTVNGSANVRAISE